MFNIIKYDFKNQLKNLIGTLIILLFLNFTVLYYKDVLTMPGAAAITFTIAFACFIGVMINGIQSYTKELYSDTGYLLFSTPSRGISIIAGKLLFSIIQCLLLFLITYLFLIPYFSHIKGIPSPSFITVLTMILSFLFGYAFLLISIYFSAAFSKMIAKVKKWGTLSSFIIFIGFWFIYGRITELISYAIPFSASLDFLTFNGTVNSSNITISIPTLSFNIAGFIFDIIVFAALIFGASYITEKKLDL